MLCYPKRCNFSSPTFSCWAAVTQPPCLMGSWAFIWLLIRCIDGFNSCCSPLLLLSRAVISDLSLAGSGILGAHTRKQRGVGKKSWEEPAGFPRRGQNPWGCGFRNWSPELKWQRGGTYMCWGQTHGVLRQVSATCVKKEAVCVCVCVLLNAYLQI